MCTTQWDEVIFWLAQNHPTLIKVTPLYHNYRGVGREIYEWRGTKVRIPINSLAFDNPQYAAIKRDIVECCNKLTG